jgi:hypothetical protein
LHCYNAVWKTLHVSDSTNNTTEQKTWSS